MLLQTAAQADCGAVANNLVQNCGFESGSFANWSTLGVSEVSPSRNFAFEGIGVSTLFPAHSGDYAASFGGSGQISQSLTTIPTHTYAVQFYLDIDAAYGIDLFFSEGNYPWTINQNSLDAAIAPAFSYQTCSNSFFGPGFQLCTYQFHAVSTEADLSFGDLPIADQCLVGYSADYITSQNCTHIGSTSGNPLFPFLLDDISVVDCTAHTTGAGCSGGVLPPGSPVPPATPEPGTASLLLGGGVVLAVGARRGQRNASVARSRVVH